MHHISVNKTAHSLFRTLEDACTIRGCREIKGVLYFIEHAFCFTKDGYQAKGHISGMCRQLTSSIAS